MNTLAQIASTDTTGQAATASSRSHDRASADPFDDVLRRAGAPAEGPTQATASDRPIRSEQPRSTGAPALATDAADADDEATGADRSPEDGAGKPRPDRAAAKATGDVGGEEAAEPVDDHDPEELDPAGDPTWAAAASAALPAPSDRWRAANGPGIPTRSGTPRSAAAISTTSDAAALAARRALSGDGTSGAPAGRATIGAGPGAQETGLAGEPRADGTNPADGPDTSASPTAGRADAETSAAQLAASAASATSRAAPAGSRSDRGRREAAQAQPASPTSALEATIASASARTAANAPPAATSISASPTRRTGEPAAKSGERGTNARDGEPSATAAAAGSAFSAAAAEVRGPDRAPSRGPAAPAAPSLPLDGGEPAVAGAVLPAGAHLRFSSDTLGDVALHLRIQDGVAHVRVESAAGASFQARAPELARALAAEGIGLARLEVEPRAAAVAAPAASSDAGMSGRTGADGSGAGRRDGQPTEPSPRTSPPATDAPARPRTRTHAGAHDVTA